jgi:hypothetical protein
MNKQIALILLSRLTDAAYLDRTSGIVQVLRRMDQISQDGPLIEKRIPYAHDASLIDNTVSGNAMIPNSAFKSCLYFEDQGISKVSAGTRGITYDSRMRLVCWMNMRLAFGDYNTAKTALVMADIISRLTTVRNFNSGFFSTLNCSVTNIPAQNAAIFQDYDYSEVEAQYMMPPFDFFALELNIRFTVPQECIDIALST